MYNDGKFKFWKRKNKDIRNRFRLKKELNWTAIKDIRNVFRQEKEIKAIKGKHLDILRIFLRMKKTIKTCVKIKIFVM